jgi:hypothetical protein
MTSPTLSYHSQMAPPVRPSRSLEGLERVIPPLSPSQFSPRLFLDKPLPAKPLDPESSAMWSDSDSQSTLDSITGSSEPRYSTDSYPIFVSSGNDFDDLVDPSADQLLDPSPQGPLDKRPDSINIKIKINEPQIAEQPSVSLSSSFDTQYGRPVNWSQNRTGTNHYFREKKWDYFPELAPSTLQASGRISPNMSTQSNKARKKGTALDFAKGKYRWHSLDRGGLGGVRDSIKTYVHRTLSRDSTESKAKDLARPSTAMDHNLKDVGSIPTRRAHTPPHTGLALDTGITRTVSVATSSSSEYDYTNHKFHLQTPISPTSPTAFPLPSPTTPRPKQLAVPLSPYQKHGAAIWEKKEKASKRNVQCPYKSSPNLAEPSSSSAPELSFTRATLPLSPRPFQTRGVFLGAKKKIVEAKEEKRREQLKARIKLVGPVNPHTYVQADPWV